MTESSLIRIAADFSRLADRFQGYSRRSEKPQHLLVNISQTGIQTGRLLQQAAEAGAFEGESWWTEGKSPFHPFDDGEGNSIRYESETEFFSFLWIHAIGSWLEKRYPERFRLNAGGWNWKHVARDEKGRLLGLDGKPLGTRRYKDGKPLTKTFRRTPKNRPGKYESRLEGKIAKKEDFYDYDDCFEHARIRAEVYEDACRLLSDLISDSDSEARVTNIDEQQQHGVNSQGVADVAPKSDPTKPDDNGYVASPAEPNAYFPVTEILAKHCDNIGLTSVKTLTKIIEEYESNRIRWTRPPNKKTGVPHPRRRSVHLIDWLAYAKKIAQGGGVSSDRGFPDMSQEEIERRKTNLREDGAIGK